MLIPRARSKRAAAGAAVLSALLGAVAAAFGHPAAGDQSESGLEPIGTLAPDDALDPRILELDFDSGAYRWAVDRLESALFDREQAGRDLRGAAAAASDLERRVTTLEADVAAAAAALLAGDTELEQLQSELSTRAVERFVRHGGDIGDELDPVRSVEVRRSSRLSREVDEAQLHRRAELLRVGDELRGRLDELRAEAVYTGISLAARQAEVSDLEGTIESLDSEIDRATDDVTSTRRTARVAGTGISTIALDAYLDAEVRLAEADPSCRFSWWMVAAVARVESRHGELGGRRIRADGRVDDPIIGIALDGGPRVQLVHDTDGGRLDGDAELDRAVGPLQFIPETWDRLGRDGNDDGVEDPQNIYDAALAAAGYLCRLGSDLGDSAVLRAAYHGYNSSQEYVEDVMGHAARYTELGLPPPHEVEPEGAST